MKIKGERGYTGISIAISVVIIFIFVSLISMLIYNYNSGIEETRLKAEATAIAVDIIEDIKNEGYVAKYDGVSINNDNNVIIENETIANEEGFYKTVTVTDYTDIEGNEDKISDLVKKVTVKISYKFKNKIQEVELSTILSKEN